MNYQFTSRHLTGWTGKDGLLYKKVVRIIVSPVRSPKGAKVYPASRRRSNKRVGLKGQLGGTKDSWLHVAVPWMP